MEALKVVAVLLVVVFVQVFGTLGTPLSSGDQDGEIWTVENWQHRGQHRLPQSRTQQGYPMERGITLRLADLIKRSKAQQFHGLMGRSSGTLPPARQGRKRNKGEMFVGLMGRRSLGGDMKEKFILNSY